MGRKKRPAGAVVGDAVSPIPPPPIAFDQYGRPLPPPPLPPGQPVPVGNDAAAGGGASAKRSRADQQSFDAAAALENGERHAYPVKKYRPDSYYRSIEAFQRYTKAHRMLDAAYVRWTRGGGATPEKPIVFGIRIAGSFLSWGRGKTRDAAIDAAIRAAFALVAAHGYDDFAFTEDCFTEEPVVSMAPIPPPPPPPPFGAPPLPPGMPPPLPPGGLPPNFTQAPPGHPGGIPPPNFPPPPQPRAEDMIPQPLAPNANLAVASAVVTTDGSSGIGVPSAKLAVGLGAQKSAVPSTSNVTNDMKKKSNGLVFAGETVDENKDELSMEEVRMQVPRYWTLVVRALAKTE